MVDKRKRSAGSSVSRKRQRKQDNDIDADPRSDWLQSISSTYDAGLVSVRPRHLYQNDSPRFVARLANICMDIVLKLCIELRISKAEELQVLPAHLLQHLFSRIKQSRAELLNSDILTKVFLNPTSDGTLNLDDVPGVNAATIKAIPKSLKQSAQFSQLSRLSLAGLPTISDATFAGAFGRMSDVMLETLILRGSVKVGNKTIAALGKANWHTSLKTLNLNFTSPTASVAVSFAAKCEKLEILKLAGLGIASANTKWAVDWTSGSVPFSHLRNFKIRAARISLQDLKAILRLCYPTLETLDISFITGLGTQMKGLESLDERSTGATLLPFPPPKLTKLDISAVPLSCAKLLSSFISNYEIQKQIALENNLPTPRPIRLAINHAFNRARLMPLLSTSLTHAFLLQSVGLADSPALRSRSEDLFITRLSLQNQKWIGKDSQWMIAKALAFMSKHCVELNLSGTSVDSECIAGISCDPILTGQIVEYMGMDIRDAAASRLYLMPETYHLNPTLKTLRLDHTQIDKDAMPAIAHCSNLTEFSLASTRVGAPELLVLLNDLKSLEILNLTSCREIEREDRRFFFEKWERDCDPQKSYVTGTQPYRKGHGLSVDEDSG